MNITISGPPGSGKSTTSKALAERLKMRLVIGGEIFRQMAKERNMSLAEFSLYCEKHPDVDIELDKRLKAMSEKEDNLIIESRLAGHLCNAKFRIWLDAPANVRVSRLKKRQDKEETAEEMLRREQSEIMRYKEYYDIDMNNKSVYNMVIDTSNITIEETVDMIVKEMKKQKILK